MNTRHSDLIAIANADLADKLMRGQSKNDEKDNLKREGGEHPSSGANKADSAEGVSTADTSPHQSFQHDAWRAVYTLNVFRYALGLGLLILVTTSAIYSDWQIFRALSNPKLFFFGSTALLSSAILFSYISKHKETGFNTLIASQFSLDVILCALLTHATGSVDSNFIILYMIAVATGSVVLPRRYALALASGAIIALFAEHFYSLWSAHVDISPHYSLLATYGLVLFASSLLISYLAERIRVTELKNYVPGNESIEDFLVREEVSALKAALKKTEGNKTEAAKLLGMSFRSFRYKLTKYNID